MDLVHELQRDPKSVLANVIREASERSLLGFIRSLWSVLEPKRKFVEGRVIEAICEHLEAVTHGQITRLLINVPPGCMKSLTTCVFWPAWEWGPQKRPDTRIITASYSDDLTIRDNRKCRQLIESKYYQKIWGDVFSLTSDQNAKVRYDNSKTGFRVATSVKGLATGERADRFVIDDPHNVREAESDAIREGVIQWFTEVVPSRLNDPERSAILCIMQRVHESDVSGHILASELGWDHLCLPMEYEEDHPSPSKTRIGFKDWRKKPGELLWPDRFTESYLTNELKPTMRSWGGEYAEAGQLQQRPAPRGGGLFKVGCFGFIDVPPSDIIYRVRGWDLASTKKKRSAYTTGVRLALCQSGMVILENVIRFKGSPLEVEQKLRQTADADGVETIISIPRDPGQAGDSQVAQLASLLSGFVVKFSAESGDKEARAVPFSAQVEAGNVFLVRAPWNKPYLAEAGLFPNSKFKDQIDATSRAYFLIQKKKKQRLVPSGPRLIT